MKRPASTGCGSFSSALRSCGWSSRSRKHRKNNDGNGGGASLHEAMCRRMLFCASLLLLSLFFLCPNSPIRRDLPLYHLRVRGKGGLFHRAADNLQPQQRLRAGISCISTAAASSRRTVISFIGVLSPFLRRKNAEQTWNGIKFGSASVRLA